MKKQRDIDIYNRIKQLLDSYQSENNNVLAGIINPISKHVLIRQMVDSVKRIEYIRTLINCDISEERTNPASSIFDPIRAAIWHNRNGNIDEALWLVLLIIHFGESYTHGWSYTKAVYGKLGSENYWNWNSIKDNIPDFINWLDVNFSRIKSLGKFGNHRQYQSLSATSNAGTGATIRSYVNFFGNDPHHLIETIDEETRNSPKDFFSYLYKIMNNVMGLGRLGKFDFLTMVGKMSIYPIEPGHPYLNGATGPLIGAKKLYNLENESPAKLNEYLTHLGDNLDFPFIMQILEDSLCNWQKDPGNYINFRG